MDEMWNDKNVGGGNVHWQMHEQTDVTSAMWNGHQNGVSYYYGMSLCYKWFHVVTTGMFNAKQPEELMTDFICYQLDMLIPFKTFPGDLYYFKN